MKRDVNRAFGRRFNGWYGRVLRCTSKLLALRHQLQVLQRSHEVCVCESGPLALGLVVTVQRLANGTRHREAGDSGRLASQGDAERLRTWYREVSRIEEGLSRSGAGCDRAMTAPATRFEMSCGWASWSQSCLNLRLALASNGDV